MLGRLVRLAAVAGIGTWLAERRLAVRAGGAGPEPIRTTVDIDAPPDDVWAVLADIEAQPDWMHDLIDVDILGPLPVGVGTRALGRVRALGIEIEDPIEISAFDAPSHFGLRHVGLVRGHGDIRLEPLRDGGATRVTWDEVLAPPVLPHLGARAIAFVFGPIFEADLARLKTLVERGEETPRL